jgi:hypothetical protein
MRDHVDKPGVDDGVALDAAQRRGDQRVREQTAQIVAVAFANPRAGESRRDYPFDGASPPSASEAQTPLPGRF